MRDILGVELGASLVKVIQLRVSGKYLSVSAYGQKEVWPLLAEAKTDDDRQAAYVQALKEAVKASRSRVKSAAVALSGNAAPIKFLKLPKTFKRRDPETGLPEEARALIPFEPSETELSIRNLRGQDKADKLETETMMVMAERRTISDAVEILRRAGLRPEVVVNDALALETLYGLIAESAEDTLVLVNVGAATTSVNVIENGLLEAVRTFNIAGDAFTRAIKREFDVAVHEAEQLKKEYGLLGHRLPAESRPPRDGAEGKEAAMRIYNDTAARVSRALKPAVKDLASGIQRTIEAYIEKRAEFHSPVSRVVLTGGSADMKALADVVRIETGLRVELLRPLENAGTRGAKGSVDKASAGLSVVAGLALSAAARRPALKINLLPKQAQRAAAIRNLAPALALLSIIAFAAAGTRIMYLSYSSRVFSEAEHAEHNLLKMLRPKPKAPPPPAPKPKAPDSPFAYLKRLKVSGTFGNRESSMVLLVGGGGVYVAKAGRLYLDDGKEVAGVTSAIVGNKLVLKTARNDRFTIELPK